MKQLLKRLRGAIGTGVTWALGWGGLGAVHGFLVGYFRPWQWELYNPILATALGYGVAGFIAGSGFGVLLASLDSAGWGDVAATAVVTATLGGLSAIATLRVARTGPLSGSADDEAITKGIRAELLARPVPDWVQGHIKEGDRKEPARASINPDRDDA